MLLDDLLRARARGRRDEPSCASASRGTGRGGDHASQQLADADAPAAEAAARPRESSFIKLFWSEMSQRMHDTVMDVLGPRAALPAATRRRAAGSPLVPLVPGGVDLRRHVGDPAQHPRGARARAAAVKKKVVSEEGAGAAQKRAAKDKGARLRTKTKAPKPKTRAQRRRSRQPGAPTLPLAGIRILDLGTRIAAPFAATLLADFGAEVIKVELPKSGDFMRTIGPFVDGYSLWWAVEGRGKKSITLDLRKPEGTGAVEAPDRGERRRRREFPAGDARGMGSRATRRCARSTRG